MAGKSDFFENTIVDVFLRGQGATIGGKALAWSAGAPALYVGLGTAEADTGLTELGATGAYARAKIPTGSAMTLSDGMSGTLNASQTIASSGTGGASSNLGVVTFPTATADWNSAATIGFFGIFDAASGGNCLYTGTITTPRAVTNGTTASFAAGTLTVTEG